MIYGQSLNFTSKIELMYQYDIEPYHIIQFVFYNVFILVAEIYVLSDLPIFFFWKPVAHSDQQIECLPHKR